MVNSGICGVGNIKGGQVFDVHMYQKHGIMNYKCGEFIKSLIQKVTPDIKLKSKSYYVYIL